jgi:hypothetical protein
LALIWWGAFTITHCVAPHVSTGASAFRQAVHGERAMRHGKRVLTGSIVLLVVVVLLTTLIAWLVGGIPHAPVTSPMNGP